MTVKEIYTNVLFSLFISVLNIIRLDLEKPIVSTCYVGLAASFMAGVLHILGKDVPVYYVRKRSTAT